MDTDDDVFNWAHTIHWLKDGTVFCGRAVSKRNQWAHSLNRVTCKQCVGKLPPAERDEQLRRLKKRPW